MIGIITNWAEENKAAAIAIWVIINLFLTLLYATIIATIVWVLQLPFRVFVTPALAAYYIGLLLGAIVFIAIPLRLAKVGARDNRPNTNNTFSIIGICIIGFLGILLFGVIATSLIQGSSKAFFVPSIYSAIMGYILGGMLYPAAIWIITPHSDIAKTIACQITESNRDPLDLENNPRSTQNTQNSRTN